MNTALVSLDAMIFIYLFDEDKRYIKKILPLFEKIEQGKLKAVTSIITPLETLSAPKLESDLDRRLAFSRFFQKTPNLSIIEVNWAIIEKSAQLRRVNPNLRTPDSIQLATAIESGAKIFITNDKKLININTVSITKCLINDIDNLLHL